MSSKAWPEASVERYGASPFRAEGFKGLAWRVGDPRRVDVNLSRTGQGNHLLLIHPEREIVIWVSRHTKKDLGRGLARQILKDAGVEP